ncbi:hypothetical protein ABKA04_007970 [Annulohypoxylon sp. FPYF3050]
MASIGNITAAGLSAKNENTLALANLNFDFSLVKIEAPKEFHQLGKDLSTWRRKTAEEGSVHRTARKLGALFEQVSTPGPELVKAYGQRASQISSSNAVRHNEKRWNSIFQDQAGTDATAIWAAAVSGTPAIGVVLLACMLARMWDAPKATSIWSELVEKRKDQIPILYDGSQPSHIAPLAAARQEITRRELAEWDDSARAWLRIADKVKDTEHRKMEDILMRLSLPVDNNSDVFESVTRAWKTSMTTMENLCKGMPQRVHDGAVLIAITAWHLYPDVSLYGPQSKTLQQRDSLVFPGGQLTVGLEDANPSSTAGVYWSLSLASLRFYGDPVLATSNAKDASRVTFPNMVLIYMGSLLAGWESDDFDASEDQEKGAKFIVDLWKSLNNVTSDDSKLPEAEKSLALQIISAPNTWFHLLVSTARDLLSREGHEKRIAHNLVSLGIRRGVKLLQPENEPGPSFFGLLDVNTWLRLTPPGGEVKVLRNIAKELKLDCRFSKLIIRYHQVRAKSAGIEFATVFSVNGGIKRDSEGNEQITQRHVRWIFKNAPSHVTSRHEDRYSSCDCRSSGKASCYNELPVHSRPAYLNKSQALVESLEEWRVIDSDHISPMWEDSSFDWARSTTKDESEHPVQDQHSWSETIPSMEESSELMKWEIGPIDKYHFLLGDIDNAAIFVCFGDDEKPINEGTIKSSELMNLKPDVLLSLLKTSSLNVVELLREISSSDIKPDFYITPNLFSRSMQVLATAAETYSNLPDATISLRVLEQNLCASSWFRRGVRLPEPLVHLLKPVELGLPEAFSCVSMFETGSLQIDPDELIDVLAMSSGNSIIAAASIFVDPFDAQSEKGLRGIVGNVGRPGVSMLIPPANPSISKASLDSWKLINHDKFDGKCSDSFNRTSVHLSFTGYEQSIASSILHGAQDSVACYLETAVSVFDESKWIGDLDIFSALHRGNIIILPKAPQCNHAVPDSHQSYSWVSINSWDELLEMPDRRNNIVTAHCNSLSRLAAAVMCVQKYGADIKCHVLPPDICCYRCAVGDFGTTKPKNGREVFICYNYRKCNPINNNRCTMYEPRIVSKNLSY